MRKYNKS